MRDNLFSVDENELNCPPVFNHFCPDLNLNAVKDLKYLLLLACLKHSGLLFVGIRHNLDFIFACCFVVYCEQTFDAKLLHHDVRAALTDAHDTGRLAAL